MADRAGAVHRRRPIERTSRQDPLGIICVAQPLLDELAATSGENAHLVVREGARSVCIALSESPQPLRLYARVGRRGPLHAGGASKVLLAHAPAEVGNEVVSRDLKPFTPSTITNPEELFALLETIREEGIHECADDLDEGAFSIAAPVRDHTDEVVAALSVAGPTSRLSREARHWHRSLVRDYATRLSKQLGWTPRSPAPS